MSERVEKVAIAIFNKVAELEPPQSGESTTYEAQPEICREHTKSIARAAIAEADANAPIPEGKLPIHLAIPSANYWFQAARDEKYPLAERFLFLENALNHTHNAYCAKIGTEAGSPYLNKPTVSAERKALELAAGYIESIIPGFDRVDFTISRDIASDTLAKIRTLVPDLG